MTNWNERKTKALSSLPLWLEKAVGDYQRKFGFQSWSAAALEILAIHLNQFDASDGIQFGDAEFEQELLQGFDEYDAKAADDGKHVTLDDYLRELVAPSEYGGDRKSNGRTGE